MDGVEGMKLLNKWCCLVTYEGTYKPAGRESEHNVTEHPSCPVGGTDTIES